MDKKNLLFDATIFAQSYATKTSRTGIFIAANNILKQFDLNSQFNITFYIQDFFHTVWLLKKNQFFSKFPVYVYTDELSKYRIKLHKYNIKKANKLFKKVIYFIMLLINYLFRIFYHNIIYSRHNNEQILKSTDIYFSPLFPPPGQINKYPAIKQFVFLHDTTPLHYPEYFSGTVIDDFWFNKLVRSINKNTHYFCNSESTKNDFLKYFSEKFDKNKLNVTLVASSQNFYPEYNKKKLSCILRKYHIKIKNDFQYIFSFCTLEPRKNLIFTLNCFIKFIKKHNIENLYFFLGGTQWKHYIKQLKEKIVSFDEYSSKIIRLGYVDDEDVNILYSNSLFFTYLSQYEGFGTPVLEAMQSGSPVICSNNSSLPEVAGNAAIMIDYNDEEQCVKAFEDLYFNEDLRKHYTEKGLERAKLFSWEKTVGKMEEVIFNSFLENK
jgi:glycosyltransferase involved in cell wall biosynthesis